MYVNVRALGDDKPVVPVVAADPIVRIEAATAEILERQRRDADARKLTTLVAIASALFAAVRLGIIAVPAIRRRRAAGATMAAPAATSNPARRRR